MHKKWTASVALLLTLVLFSASVNHAWQGAAAITKPDSAALNATDEILKVVSRLRSLSIKQSVKSSFKTKDEIEQSVIHDLDENTPAEEFEASQKTLIKLGLVSRDFHLRDYVVKLLREQVAGYYEPKTKEFYLAAWLPLSEQKKVIAHELVHALQDQHFNLSRFERWPKGDSHTRANMVFAVSAPEDREPAVLVAKVLPAFVTEQEVTLAADQVSIVELL